ncbi:putative quinol monooxygenase [Penaeicola halotolerans]|uniref:putative quinol monooxygenase n=1 Tax=Penaeicola halotolerans TaxID=2793196 RepID=UPI001CF8AC41|nr:antibiotic biosynthesis monooxygenase family protein [Penaeicola halotolerans]
MLIRTVRMTFRPEEVDHFLAIFEASKEKIRHFEGCHHLTLWQDYHASNVFTTYSYWEDESALNKYRDSQLFKEVWAQTKVLFAEKPVAQSQKKLLEVL